MKHDGLHKRGRRWYFWLRVDGKPKACATGTESYRDARTIRARRLAAHYGKPGGFGAKSFADAAAEWTGSAEFKTLALASKKSALARLNNLLRVFGTCPLGEITPEKISAYRQARLEKIRPQSVNGEVTVLRAILHREHTWTQLHAEASRPLRAAPTERAPRALSREELERLLRVARSNWRWKQLAAAIALCVHTGLRSAELRGLRRCDVQLDADRPRLQVRRASTKTPAGERAVLLDAEAVNAARQLLTIAGSMGFNHRACTVFPTRGKDGKLAAMSRWPRAWKTISRRAGLPDLRFHDLRHTYVTVAAEAGVPIDVTMRQVGHLNAVMTRKYTHVSDKGVSEAIAAIAKRLPSTPESS